MATRSSSACVALNSIRFIVIVSRAQTRDGQSCSGLPFAGEVHLFSRLAPCHEEVSSSRSMYRSLPFVDPALRARIRNLRRVLSA